MSKYQAVLFAVVLLGALAIVAAQKEDSDSGGADTGKGKAKAGAKAEKLTVLGSVYCDTCRAQFKTKVSPAVPNAKVMLQCRNITGDIGKVDYKVEGVTDKEGKYKLPVEGDHEDYDCDVTLVSSPMDDCKEIPKDAFAKQAAKVSLTANDGIVQNTRNANPLGFMKKKPDPECQKIFKDLDIPFNPLPPSGSN